MADRMTVDPDAIPQPDPDAPACPTGNRTRGPEIVPLDPAAEAARRAALPEIARRALEEADARKREVLDLPPELGGRDGPEPVRYGDWENKGIAIDF
ncbi:DUF1674 domain-containing protein [Jannaschia ovalis]|uniref:DUF1674 domain-containing protein n=1 Tax=Jannaschia ovalis TaxID=3038773 RepID=A0ABY8LES0_9RHOB|nr:DUF1674 domain-containing protein [Jannaschia sp. GRR-S6-38]WGH79809.1 DUF1674 domain-containing protein [Jannaschia sp. GRR-S6-38]